MKTLCIFFLLTSISCLAQSQVFYGKVVAQHNGLEGVKVDIKNRYREVYTKEGGHFSMRAAVYDTLTLSSSVTETKIYVVKNEDLIGDLKEIDVILTVTELKEIQINTRGLDPVALGILNKPAKKYTTNERRLYTAMNPGGGLFIIDNLDYIINTLTGKIKELKKNVKVEKYVAIERQLSMMYTEETLVKVYKIPQLYINGFLVYTSYDERLPQALKFQNKTICDLIVSLRAVEFRKIMKEGGVDLNTLLEN